MGVGKEASVLANFVLGTCSDPNILSQSSICGGYTHTHTTIHLSLQREHV